MAKKIPEEAREHAVVILERLLTLSNMRQAAKSKRDFLFGERDAIEEEINDCEDEDSKECIGLKAKHHDVCRDIDKLRIDIRYFADQTEKAIIESAQAKFDFMDEPVKPPKELYEKEAAAKKKEQEKQQLRITPPDDLPTTDGVDEHLVADVKELGLADKDTDRLVAAGMPTIGHVAKVLDSSDTLSPLMAKLDCGQEIAGRIKNAVGKFRKIHRKAMLAKQREEAGE